MTPQQKIVFDSLRPAADRDPYGVKEARAMLDTAYAWLDRKLAGREWATGGDFNLADCAAAPALFYADWTHRDPFGLRQCHGLPAAPAGTSVVCPRGGRGTAVPSVLSARCTRPRLSEPEGNRHEPPGAR